MIKTRREVLAGGLAAVAAAAGGTPAWAATAKKTASSYFAGTAVDNGVTYRTTNFNKIDKKWHKQVVKYFSTEPQGTVVVDTINGWPGSRSRRRATSGAAERVSPTDAQCSQSGDGPICSAALGRRPRRSPAPAP